MTLLHLSVQFIYLHVFLTTISFKRVCICALNTFVDRLQDINVLTKKEVFERIFFYI